MDKKRRSLLQIVGFCSVTTATSGSIWRDVTLTECSPVFFNLTFRDNLLAKTCSCLFSQYIDKKDDSSVRCSVEDQKPRPILIKKTAEKETVSSSTKKKSLQDLIRNDPSQKYLLKQFRSRSSLTFICYSEEIVGQIEKIERYDLILSGREEFLNKTEIIYLYKSEAAASVQKAVRIDDEVADQKLTALYKKDKRLDIPESVMAKCIEEKRVITVTMRNGHVLAGRIHSYGIFSIRLTIAQDIRVITMRHSIYDIDYSA